MHMCVCVCKLQSLSAALGSISWWKFDDMETKWGDLKETYPWRIDSAPAVT